MVKAKDTSTLFKSYGLLHKANPHKVDILFNLYKVYTSEYQFHVNKFKAKLDELSLFYGFMVEEFNPAYTSQECSNCAYVDKNNRNSQATFKCLCCGMKLNADVQGSRVVSKRFRSQQNSTFPHDFPYSQNLLTENKN